MKITKLLKASDYRIFRGFAWPAGLPEFARFNVIYGWNGSGKTSLSNIFRHIQRREPLTHGQVEVLIDQTRVAGTEFGVAALPAVRVFNRDAIDRNIFELGNQQFPPVFFLGEDSVERQRQIEDLKQQLDATVKQESGWERKRSDAASALETFCAEEAKGIKNLLTVAGGGPFNNYNAANFRADLQRLKNTTPIPDLLTADLRKQHLATKDGKAMAHVSQPSVNFPDFADLIEKTQAMLSRSVVSSVISELAENPAVAAWVNAGLELHTGQLASSRCRFCDEPLPVQRMRQLEAHFNNEFKRFLSDIDALIARITSAQQFAQEFRAPPKEALYENLRSQYEQALQTLNQQALTVRMSLDVLSTALNAKRDEPFKTFELAPFIASYSSSGNPVSGVEAFFRIAAAGFAALSAAMGRTAFDQLKSIISRHNEHTDSFDVAVKAARLALAQHEALRALADWSKKSKAVEKARDDTAIAHNRAEKFRKQIAELEVQVRQHRRPAEELNREVTAYLGRDELRFEVEQNGYRITRGGHPATHLSDGERTAIAFLYFLKSIQGTDFDLNTGIIVIDDPVSSLDANSLFSAFGFMKERTANAGQLFVLTHNFAFFRQVRNWYYNLPGQRKSNPTLHPARFYMLVAHFVNGRREASLQALDPFLHQYESEYHYLFKKVYEEALKPAVQGLETYYAIPNIARRVLEAFLAFRVPDKPGELFQKLEAIQYDAAKKTRILRFLHTYSHFDQVAEPDHDMSVLSETPAILQEVLELIRECDPAHFKSMTDLIVPPLQQAAVPPLAIHQGTHS
ncbi:AAA family ATPase [Burkholderia mayonis]|uniref:AAA family ATPase n=1 Tax=Burkholderia mayonis TaxID=1385591 RepID=UPI0009E68BCC|nr:AAA family ATPase [Burkholderia mayonis]